jgi:autotransporter-associated beta strand protein
VTTISGSALLQSLTASVKLNEPNNAGNVGILNLNGGTWQMLGLNNSYDANVLVNFNGGTVKAGNSANTTFLGNSATAYVYGGGGTVDNNGQAITITQPILSSVGNGVATIPVSGGAGYIMPPQVAITGGGGSGATAYAQISGGAVTGIVVTSPGINYSSVPTVTLVGGGYTSAATLGTVTTAANTSGVLTVQGTGTLTLSGVSTYTGGTTISAGTLTIGGAGQLGGGNYAGAIANSGTLIYNSSAAQTLSGGISGSGALTYQGGGTLTLSNANSYNGATTVTGGKLIGAAGSGAGMANSAVSVTPASYTAVFGVSYTGGNNQWTCPSVTFNTGGIGTGLEFDFATAPSITTAPLNITGNLTFNATPKVFVTFPATVAAGSYPLVTVGGTAPVTVPALSTRGFSGTSSLAWGGGSFGANTLVLTVSAGTYSAITGPLNWAGSGSGTWDINDAGNNIWKDSSATPNATFYQEFSVGDNVVFSDKNISANTAVTLNNTVNPNSVVFSNSLYNYSITGSGTIAGGDSLTKYGSAAVSLSTSNTYTGGTTVNAGTLNLDFTQSGAATTNILGASGAVTLAGATLGVIGNASPVSM